MARSRTYGKLDIPLIGENEPVFILRGRDILALSAIEMYRLLAEAHGCRVAEALTSEIINFKEWTGERTLPVWPILDQPAPGRRAEPASKWRRPSNWKTRKDQVYVGRETHRDLRGAGF